MRRRALAVCVATALFAAIAFVPGASGHSRTLVASKSYDQGGQRGVYRYYMMLVPAKHTHLVRCDRGSASYPDRVIINARTRGINRHKVKLDDQEEFPPPPDHSDDNEVGVTFEGRGVHIEITSPNYEQRVPDPSDFADQGPRYGNTMRIHADGTRGAYLRILCYKRFTG